MPLRPRNMGALVLFSLPLVLGCQGEATGEVGLLLVRAENIYGTHDLRDERPIDVDIVGRVTCQVLSAEPPRDVLAELSVDVEPSPSGGFQEVVLPRLPSDRDYLARFVAFRKDAPEVVHQCGVSAFRLRAGEKHWVTIQILYPPAMDPRCEAFCLAQAECAAGSICLAASCDLAAGSDCQKTHCYPQLVGSSCAASSDCASAITGLSCIASMGGVSFPGGYCSKSCGGASACPAGSSCTGYMIGTSSTRMCAFSCASDSDCRGGYTCQPLEQAESPRGCMP